MLATKNVFNLQFPGASPLKGFLILQKFNFLLSLKECGVIVRKAKCLKVATSCFFFFDLSPPTGREFCVKFQGNPYSTWVLTPKIGVKPPKSSILIGRSIIFTIHFWGTPILGNIHMVVIKYFFWYFLVCQSMKPVKTLEVL